MCRRRFLSGAAALVLTSGLVSACGGQTSRATAVPGGADTPVAVSQGLDTTAAAVAATTMPGPAGSTGSGSAAPAPSGSAAVPGVHPGCPSSVLRLTAEATTGSAPDNTFMLLVLTNTGPVSCSLKGTPAVTLFGPNDPTFGAQYMVPASSQAPALVTLTPGSAAHVSMQYLVPEDLGKSAWIPTRISVTAPGSSHPLTAKWSGRAVLRQDGATHPGTWVGPVLPGER